MVLAWNLSLKGHNFLNLITSVCNYKENGSEIYTLMGWASRSAHHEIKCIAVKSALSMPTSNWQELSHKIQRILKSICIFFFVKKQESSINHLFVYWLLTKRVLNRTNQKKIIPYLFTYKTGPIFILEIVDILFRLVYKTKEEKQVTRETHFSIKVHLY